MTGSDTPQNEGTPEGEENNVPSVTGRSEGDPGDGPEDIPFSDAEEFQGALGKLSEREPQIASMVTGMMGMGMMGNPLHQKMDGSHITQLLDLAHKHDEREYELRKQTLSDEKDDRTGDRRYIFASFVIVTGLFIALLLVFEDKPEILIRP